MAEDLTGAGKALKALERGTRELREVARDLVAPPAVELGHYFADRVRIFRFNQAIRAVRQAKEQLAKCGLRTHTIDLKLLVPMLEGASLEEDEVLVSRWAGLIASAATSSDTLPAFADILRQLTPEEARMLDFMFDNSGDTPVIGADLSIDKTDLERASGLTEEQFLIRVQNLHRLELITQLSTGGDPVRGSRGWGRSGHVGLTALGEAFLRACRGPAKLIEEVELNRAATGPQC